MERAHLIRYFYSPPKILETAASVLYSVFKFEFILLVPVDENDTNSPVEMKYEVLFDQSFLGAVPIRYIYYSYYVISCIEMKIVKEFHVIWPVNSF